MSAMDVGYSIAKMEAKPGDVIVVRFNYQIPSQEIMSRIRASVQQALPDGVRVLVTDSTCDLSVLSFDDVGTTSSHAA